MKSTRCIATCLATLALLLVACGGTNTSTDLPDAAAEGRDRTPSLEGPEGLFQSPEATYTPAQATDTATAPTDLPADLDGTEWILESLAGGDPLPGTQITLSFEGDQVRGFSGCNSYGGTTRAAGGSLAFAEIAITAQACLDPEGVMEQEAAYIDALLAAPAYRVVEDRLELANAAGETTLIFAKQARYAMDPGQLLGTNWQLVALEGVGSSGVDLGGLTVTLAFHSENLVIGHAGCRDYVATYGATGDRLGFPSIAMVEAGCGPAGSGPSEQNLSEAVMAIEGRFTDGLTWATHHRLTGGKLEISTARGEVLYFEPLPDSTAEALQRTYVLSAFLDENWVEGLSTPLVMPSDVLPSTEITAQFADGVLSGSAGCSRYGAAYTVEGPSIGIEAPDVTDMACGEPAGIMQQELRYLASLPEMRSYRIYGDQLLLGTDDGRTLYFRLYEGPGEPSG